MANSITAKSFRAFGNSEAGLSRRSVSYTPAADMTLHHFSFVAKRIMNDQLEILGAAAFNDIETIIWEIRVDDGANNKPISDATAALATGSFDFRFSSEWKQDRVIEFTVNLTTPLALDSGVLYHFVLKTPSDEPDVYRPLAWADTYNTGAGGEVDAAVYCSEYTGAAWITGDNSYNLQLTILDDQAGGVWHIIIDGQGYMQPDKFRGYQCEQVSSGIAESRGGQSEYSQLRYPYSNLSQDDWTSGIGQLTMDDLHAYLYGGALDTTVQNQAMIGPLVHETGVADEDRIEYIPSSIRARYLVDPEHSTATDSVSYYAQKFATIGAINADYLGVRINKRPYQYRHSCSICICETVAGNPTAVVAGGVTGWKALENVWRWDWRDVAGGGVGLGATTDYWVVVKTSQSRGYMPEHRLMFDADGSATGGAAKYSHNGTAWTALAQSMVFRINYGTHVPLEDEVMAFAYGNANDTPYLIVAGGKKVYKFDTGTGYWVDISAGIESYIGGGGALTTNDITDLQFFYDRLYVAQGYDQPIRQWSGTAWGPAAETNLCEGHTFSDNDDIAEWTVAASAALNDVGGGNPGNCGELECNGGGGGFHYAYQEFTVVDGEYYEVTYHHKNGGGGGDNKGLVRIGSTLGDNDIYNSDPLDAGAWTEKHVLVTAVGTSMFFHIYTNGDANNDITLYDNVLVYRAPSAKELHIARGLMWGTNARNEVRFSNTGLTWSSSITVGDPLYEIKDFVDYASRLLVGKENGMWNLDRTDLATEYFLFPAQTSPLNCKGWTVWSGILYIPMMGVSVWAWRGTNYKEVGPSDTSTGPTIEWPNRTTRFSSNASFLFAAADPQLNSGWGGIMVYNGIGWHQICHHTRVNKKCRAIFVTSEVAGEIRVWFAEENKVDYIRLSGFSNNRYDDSGMDFDITGANLVTSWWDGGLKDAVKFWNRVTIIADVPAKGSIDVYYVKDGFDWKTVADFVLLGHLTPENLTDDGEYSLQFPDGLVAKSIQLIFRLNTMSSANTPRIKAYNIESIVRQIPVDAYSFRILLANNITKMDKTTESSRTANDMWEELKRARAKNEPVLVSFPQKTVRGMISHLQETTYRFKPDGMRNEIWERVASVSIIEAT